MKTGSKTDILIAGVGGQGILLTANMIGRTAVKMGFKVRGAETHGMAQRGGSVVSHIRIGNIASPLIPQGECDFMLGFEPVEALRNVYFLNKNAKAIVNREMIPPASLRDPWKYPRLEDVIKNLSEYCELILLDASSIASKTGNPLFINMVMLGALSLFLESIIPEEKLRETIEEIIPKKTVDANLKAFDLGREEVRKKL
ncbi:MAG: indolepyruvate ferredoxin oxidoreductase subunit beta [Candidatus Hydrothermarchaeota archaeon]